MGRENSGYEVDRQTLADIASLNNGRLFNVYSTEDLEEVYAEIDQLEASVLPIPVSSFTGTTISAGSSPD